MYKRRFTTTTKSREEEKERERRKFYSIESVWR
jgi:hypothetical protein